MSTVSSSLPTKVLLPWAIVSARSPFVTVKVALSAWLSRFARSWRYGCPTAPATARHHLPGGRNRPRRCRKSARRFGKPKRRERMSVKVPFHLERRKQAEPATALLLLSHEVP